MRKISHSLSQVAGGQNYAPCSFQVGETTVNLAYPTAKQIKDVVKDLLDFGPVMGAMYTVWGSDPKNKKPETALTYDLIARTVFAMTVAQFTKGAIADGIDYAYDYYGLELG